MPRGAKATKVAKVKRGERRAVAARKEHQRKHPRDRQAAKGGRK